jgi:formamidopyrimidine-DNA glycosylase
VPELPEVECGRRQAERALLGKHIERVATTADAIVFDGVTPRRFAAALRGRRVEAVGRRGKHLWFALDRRPWPTFHYGMTGSFQVYRDVAERPRFWKFELLATDGTRLAMPNARRLGRIRLREDPRHEPPISGLGFDTLDDLPGPAKFAELVRRRKAPIKAVLMDQSFAAGVGNWIADEVLFQAGVAPQRRAHELEPEEIRRIRTRLSAIVRKAVAVDADKEQFPKSWLFHRRWGKNADAVTSRGDRITHVTIGGRTTAWVPTIQH